MKDYTIPDDATPLEDQLAVWGEHIIGPTTDGILTYQEDNDDYYAAVSLFRWDAVDHKWKYVVISANFDWADPEPDEARISPATLNLMHKYRQILGL